MASKPFAPLGKKTQKNLTDPVLSRAADLILQGIKGCRGINSGTWYQVVISSSIVEAFDKRPDQIRHLARLLIRQAKNIENTDKIGESPNGQGEAQ